MLNAGLAGQHTTRAEPPRSLALLAGGGIGRWRGRCLQPAKVDEVTGEVAFRSGSPGMERLRDFSGGLRFSEHLFGRHTQLESFSKGVTWLALGAVLRVVMGPFEESPAHGRLSSKSPLQRREALDVLVLVVGSGHQGYGAAQLAVPGVAGEESPHRLLEHANQPLDDAHLTMVFRRDHF